MLCSTWTWNDPTSCAAPIRAVAAPAGQARLHDHGPSASMPSCWEACPELRFVSTVSVGFNHIDVPACTARGVVVTNTPDVLDREHRDFGFALMMAAARRMSEGERMLRDGRGKALELGLAGRRRCARRHAWHPGHGPHRPGDCAARPPWLRHARDLSQPQPPRCRDRGCRGARYVSQG